MGDPFRPPLWRDPRLLIAALFCTLLAAYVLVQRQREAVRAQTPAIISATYLGTGAIMERRFEPRAGQAVFVRMKDGSRKRFRISEPGRSFEGCTIGGPIFLEQRGLALSLGREPCPELPANAAKPEQR